MRLHARTVAGFLALLGDWSGTRQSSVKLTLITGNTKPASVAERPVALAPKREGAMYPNPPRCEKCRKPMHHVATMPVAGAVGRKATLFHCESCDQLTWIEE